MPLLVHEVTVKREKDGFLGSGPSLDTEHVSALILSFPVSKTVGNKFLLFIIFLVYGILLQQPEQTDTILACFLYFMAWRRLSEFFIKQVVSFTPNNFFLIT